MEDDERPDAFALLAAWLTWLWLIVMTVGLYGAAFGWRPGAYFMITALLGYIVSHLLIGITEYRRVMRRPWPQVRPSTMTMTMSGDEAAVVRPWSFASTLHANRWW